MDSKTETRFHRHFSVRLVIPDPLTQLAKANPPNLSGSDPPEQVTQDDQGSNDSKDSHSPSDSPLSRGSPFYSTMRSLHRMTREALPNLNFYRNMASIVKSPRGGQRPSIDDLLHPPAEEHVNVPMEESSPEEVSNDNNKFGWIKGVLVRCLLNIWGVILFIRISWMTAQAGILESVIIATISAVVTLITTLSMSALGTNGQVKGGGTYFMISRTLGPEVGGATGVIFSLANAIAASLNIVGFCESLNDLLGSFDMMIIDGGLNDIRLVSCITLVVLLVICFVGMEWEARCQVLLLIVLVVAMLAFVIGAFIGPLNDEEIAKGFVGLNGTVFMDNFYSDYRVDPSTGVKQDFFSVFGVFFPACTGILAGASISGDLKDPSGAIPKGTLLGIVITYLSYVLFILLCGSATVKEATGNILDLATSSFTNCTAGNCTYGLLHSFQVMELMSVYGPLIYAGSFAASLSSALASLVSAPKIFQALAQDSVYPYITFFAKGYGKNDEPIRAYILFSGVVVVFNVVARLDAIAPIITNFFLATFAIINFATFHACMQIGPGWRPTFRFYSPWLSLFGGILSVAIMFLIQWWTALITVALTVILYYIVKYRKLDINWGSSTQAQSYSEALKAVSSLNNVEEHVKNYKPQILVLSGLPSSRPPLIHFAESITKNKSLLVVAQCCDEELTKNARIRLTKESAKWLSNHNIGAFYALADGLPMDIGARVLMNNAGLGKLEPNMVLMGFKADWQICSSQELGVYFRTIHHSLDLHLAMGILRVEGGMDYSHVTESLHKLPETNNNNSSMLSLPGSSRDSLATSSSENIHAVSYKHSLSSILMTAPSSPKKKSSGLSLWKKKKDKEYRDAAGEIVQQGVVDAMLRFTCKQPKGTIDVWWLFDDGGLTLLLPYILTTRPTWSECSLRVFFLADKNDLAAEQRRMAELMGKFRIEVSDVILVPDIQQKPKDESIKNFQNLISKFQDTEVNDTEGQVISETELLFLKDKTNRHIRLRELLLEHSNEASLIVMTLPLPVIGTVSPPLYMAWLETLTRDMPPFLLLRGNQSSVLTFYS